MQSRKLYHKVLIYAILIVSCLSSCKRQEAGTVKVDGGWIRGVVTDDMTIYKGIPFAAPPVGDLRWKAPQPVKPWKGILAATDFAPSPIQDSDELTISEDCLYLNIWTPAKSPADKLPVMVWIYGGGFSIGSTSYEYSDGEELARKGVIVVSIAYRLGYLGFMAHPWLSAENENGVSGNYGLLDQIAALRWINENIQVFGGDPENVTIFGQSAGGMSVSMLCASPLAKNLFERGISQSGGSFSPCREDAYPGENMKTLQMAEADGKEYTDRLGVHSIDEMRALDDSIFARPYDATGGPGPIIDGYVLPDDQYILYENGQYNDVELLIGYNSDEGECFTETDSIGHIKSVHGRFGEYADRLLEAYPVTGNPVPKSGRDLLRDASFGWHTWTWARLKAQTGKANVYLYYFDQHDTLDNNPRYPGLAAVHGKEVGYVFQHVSENLPGEPELKYQIGEYWTNFARTGNPNGENLPEWPVFTTDSHQSMYLTGAGSGAHAGPVPDEDAMMILDEYFSWRRSLSADD